ncbi:nitrous oxide reductase accessory protein NosL [Chitinophagaceae bacterium LWZ2-11]
MSNQKLSNKIRIVLILCGVLLITVLFLPFWELTLNAPQYPEGLILKIHANKLSGDVNTINGLNHYIGMKVIHESDFPEFTILPYCVVFFALAFIITGIVLKKKAIIALFILFVLFGVIAMYDFWRWEYDYGHNLNPEAAIKVPGMAYQPPLIGFKQLLNFGVYSIPDTGGWIFIGCGLMLLGCVIAAVRQSKKRVFSKPDKIIAVLIVCFFMSSCTGGPEPILLGKDNCVSCKMTISDKRFGAELVTEKGKCYKFDDVHCLLAFMKSGEVKESAVKAVYFVDFAGTNQLIKGTDVLLIKSTELKAPMGGNIAAFSSENDKNTAMETFHATLINWDTLKTQGN